MLLWCAWLSWPGCLAVATVDVAIKESVRIQVGVDGNVGVVGEERRGCVEGEGVWKERNRFSGSLECGKW